MVEDSREFLSREKNSVKTSSEANLNSFKFNFLANAFDGVSVFSLAIRTKGTVVAFLAVLGLNTRVFIKSKDWGVEASGVRACLQASGEFV